MSIKLSGLISGMDTDAMIEELVSAYSIKKDSIYKEQKSLSYKQDAWKTLNTKLYSLFSGKLSSMRFSVNYTKKAVSVSNSNKVSVTASSTAVSGTQKLKISQLATSGYLTGAKLDGNYTADTKMSEFGVSGTTRINVSVNGKDTFVDVTEDMTIAKFTSELGSKGINASFDATNKRFFLSSKDSGADQDFSISGNDSTGNDLLKNLGLYTVSTADISSYKDYISAAEGDASYMTDLAKHEYLNSLLEAQKKMLSSSNSALDKTTTQNTADIKENNNRISFAKSNDAAKEKSLESLDKSITKLREDMTKKQEAIAAETDETKKAALQKDYDALQEKLDKANSQKEDYLAIKERVGSSDDEGFKDAVAEYEEEMKAANTELEDDNKLIKERIADNKAAMTTIDETMNKEITDKEEYLGAGTFDYDSEAFTSTLVKYNEKLETAKGIVADYTRYEELKGLGDDATEAQKSELASLNTKLGLDFSELSAVRITGQDAIISLNGAKFTSSSNVFQINGVTITATAVTDPDEEISLTTSDDVDGIYDMVKDFFKEYNSLINEMDSLYNAASAGKYEPLTEEEEGELSDKQVEKWEKKLEDAALRKDSTLGSVITLMKTAMSKGFDVDGVNTTLSTFGIKTLGYFVAGENEKGAFHIDGDSSDSAVSGNEDKLRAAIANNPEGFVSFFSQLTSNLYSQLNGKMASSSLSSAYTIYNDKYMTSQYKKYTSSISDWDKKIEKMREKYESQFAAMEKALSTLQSQQSSLSSLLGS
ncbi:MAG: flagellar filament capping protein FliD [Clostridiales bacterium]|nr:flagellar filament capping protein FliD [Clostridiales bacterium]